MKVHCIENAEVGHFLKRDYRAYPVGEDLDLRKVFCDILVRANDFVPSEAGSIFLDDPLIAKTDPDRGVIVLIAGFGEAADQLVGLRLSKTRGIVGHVYETGKTYISDSPGSDPLFLSRFADKGGLDTNSVACAPLRIDGVTIGVLELLNHRSGKGYSARDLELLEIFAQTISVSIANAIEAQRSREMAKRDDLTGLFNDRYLHHRLSFIVKEALNRGEDCGLLFIDLDHFKTINDVHGHLIGSRVLAEVGRTLHQILPGQAVPSRYGGDEFVIVMPGASRQEVFWVAETVRKNIETTVFLEEADPDDPVNYPALAIRGVITCSIGISSLREDVVPDLGSGRPDPLTAKNELIRKADTCMYTAKQKGRNRTITASRSKR